MEESLFSGNSKVLITASEQMNQDKLIFRNPRLHMLQFMSEDVFPNSMIHPFPLLQRNETRRVRSTDTGPTVFDRFATNPFGKISLYSNCFAGLTYYEIENSPK